MVDVTANCHLEGSGESLEDTFNLVMLVIAFGFNVKVNASRVGERLEEVEEHLGGNIAYLFAMELGIPHKPGTATEVECHLAEAVVHREAEAITADASLVAEGF